MNQTINNLGGHVLCLCWDLMSRSAPMVSQSEPQASECLNLSTSTLFYSGLYIVPNGLQTHPKCWPRMVSMTPRAHQNSTSRTKGSPRDPKAAKTRPKRKQTCLQEYKKNRVHLAQRCPDMEFDPLLTTSYYLKTSNDRIKSFPSLLLAPDSCIVAS